VKRINLTFDTNQFLRLQTVANSQGMKPSTWAKRATILALSAELPSARISESLDMFEDNKPKKTIKRKGGRK
jgi:hypothetical protein